MIVKEHGGNPEKYGAVLDFSANINPLGMPESVKKAVINSLDRCENYPDPDCVNLRKKLSAFHYVPVENIVCGNGADDLIYRTVHALKPRSAIVCAPAFSEYRKALEEGGCVVREFRLREENGFALTEDVLNAMYDNTDMIFICSPNNPTGRTVDLMLMEKIIRKCLQKNIYLVCDECFMYFAENSSIKTVLGMMNEKVIVLKAFTKIFAMAGLRLGYAVCGDRMTAEKIRRTGQYWSVSAPAQAAGIAALDETEYIEASVRLAAAERKYLTEELRRCWAYVYESETNFLLFRSIPQLDRFLLKEGILIRSCENYSGLDGNYYRIAVRTHEENKILAEALRRILNG